MCLLLLTIMLLLLAATSDQPDTDQVDTDPQMDLEREEDNYFVNLLQNEKNENENSDENKKDVTHIQNDSNENISPSFKKFGISSYNDLITLQNNDPEKFFKIQLDIMTENMEKINKNKMEEMENRLNIRSILLKAEQANVNTNDYKAFCLFYEIPVSNKSLDLYKDQIKKTKKDQFDNFKKQADIQKTDKKEIDTQITSEPENDYYKKAMKISKII